MILKSFGLAFFSLLCLQLAGQGQIETYMSEAQGYLAQKNYAQAKLSLQDAMNEIDQILARQIAEALPTEIAGLKATETETINTGMMGMLGGGMQISKNYQHPSMNGNEAEIQILANSPMLNAITMYMNNPSMMGQGYKSARVGSRRAILKTEMDDFYDNNGASRPIRSTEIQIPMGQTLITINAKGFASEQEELAFAGKIDFEKLRTLLGE